MKSIKTYYFFLILACLIVISSCTRSKWKETVATKIYLRMSDNEMSFGSNTLIIDTLIMHFDRLDLNGKRLQADDISLSTNLKDDFIALGTKNVLLSTMDVPQGTYEPLMLGANVEGASIPIILKGRYISASGNVQVVRIELNYNNYLFDKVLKNSSEIISINKEVTNEILINFNMELLFDEINPSYWNAATPTTIGGQNGVAVSATQNANIYNLITPKISETISFEM